jgi:hypothetical protein
MADIKYHFIADGQASVRDAFKSIGDEARSSSKAIEQGMRSIRTSSRVASQETARNQKAESERAKVVEGAIDIRRKQAEELAKQVAKDQSTQAKIAKTEQRELDKRRKEIARDVEARKQLQAKNQENERRHQEKLASIKRTQEERAERDRTKLRQQEAKHQEKLVATRSRYDEIFESRKAKKGDRFGELKATARGAFVGGSAAVVASTLGIAGSAARQSLALHEVSNRLSIAARGAGEESVDPRELRKEFEQTAAKTPGIAAIDVANAVSQFVSKTGELGVARKSQGVFATVASATGSSIEDVSAAAADLFQKFDITTVEGMADAMSALAFQGKAGSFELKDAASQFAKLSAAASRFGLAKGADGVRTLGGLTQIARSATGSPEQAATAVEAMFRQFTSSSALKKLKEIKVNPFQDKGQTKTKEIRGLLVETIAKSGGNLETLQGIFGEEGIRAISPIISEFNKAKQEASVGGKSAKESNEAGAEAARSYINKMIDAPGDYKELQKDAAQAQQDASAKLSNAWEKIVGELSDGAIPALTSLVTTLENSPGAIDALVGTIDNLIYFFTALIGAVQDLMEFLGIATKKTKSPEEQREQAKKKVETLEGQLKRFDQKRGGSREQVLALLEESQTLEKSGDKKGAREKLLQANAMNAKLDATKDQDAERNALAGKLNAAKREMTTADTQVKTVQDQQNRIRSTDAFASEYAALLEPEKNKGQNMQRAKEIAQQLRDHSMTDASTTTGQDLLPGETEAARDFRVNQATARQQSGSLQMYGQEKNADNAGAAMAKVEAAAVAQERAAKALEQAATAMKSANQTSIVPQP